jgi:hypothetical protein
MNGKLRRAKRLSTYIVQRIDRRLRVGGHIDKVMHERGQHKMNASSAERSHAVKEYLSAGFNEIRGWCTPHLWQVIQPLDLAQAELGIEGPIAEIGVFHGKFLIGLIKTKNSEGNYAIDIYDMQQFNLDGAGKGDLAALKQNLTLCKIPENLITLYRADSMTLGRNEIDSIRKGSGGGFSMFSVDGCHMVEHTINDIKIAMDLTLAGGIIFVDDYYNASWPGVQEGVAKLYLLDAPRFVPLAYLCNKLVLCHLSYHGAYLSKLKAFLKLNFPSTALKPVKRFGYDTLTVSPDIRSDRYLA